MVRIVTDFLDELCVKMPDKTAMLEINKKITFLQLRDYSKRIAAGLAALGGFRKPIVIFLDKGIDVIVSFLGCAYSGNFYSPIDPDMPDERIKVIFETLEPKCVITVEKYLERIKEISKGIKILTFSDLIDAEYDDDLILRIRRKITSKDVLYVLFTSGSTGRPKGVTISHQSVIDYSNWASKTFGITDKDVLGNQTPFYFSMSVFDIFQMLNTGCTMHIIPKELFSKPKELVDYLEMHNINTIYWVPSALNIVAKSGCLDGKDIAFLKKILFAGEVMPNSVLNIWRRANSTAVYANLFGPTEVTDICTYYVVDRDFKDEEPLPIGFPCLNTDILILDESEKLIEKNHTECIGELCVRGSTLAYGYYRNETKTREVFVQNPLNKVYDEIIYRTGDLVKYNQYGEIMYIGRKDSQIKLSGYRIELGEIEAAVSAISEIKSECCIFDKKNQLIILFFEGGTDKKDIRKQLKKLLPRYMMPHRFIRLQKMPLNANGKVDRAMLKKKYINDDLL